MVIFSKNKRAGAAVIETTITMGWFLLIIFCCLDLVRYGYNNAIAQTAVQNALEDAILNPLTFNTESFDQKLATRKSLRRGLIIQHLQEQKIDVDFNSADFTDPNNKIFYALKHIPPGTILTPPNGGCPTVAKFNVMPPQTSDEIKRPILISCVQYPMAIFFGAMNVNISAYAIGRSEQ